MAQTPPWRIFLGFFPARLDGFGLPRAQAHTATFDRVKFYQALRERYICFSPPDICADIAFLAELERSKDPVMISTIARATPPVR